MVICTKCGKENEEDAKFCFNCGATLHPEERKKRGDTCFGERRPEEECFRIPYGGAIAGIIAGVFIILIGLAIAFEIDIWRWIGVFILLIIGILVIVGATYGLRRRREG